MSWIATSVCRCEITVSGQVRIIGTVSLVLILVLALVGMDWVTRVQKLLLVLLLFSQVKLPLSLCNSGLLFFLN